MRAPRLVAQGIGRTSFGDELAKVEHRHELAARGDEAHVVIDEDHQRAALLGNALDHATEVLCLFLGQTGGGLVEQHHLRRADDGASNFHQAPIAGAEHRHLLMRIHVQSDEFDRV